MPDPVPAPNPDVASKRTFKIPVEGAAPPNPVEHEHGGKKFKIPVEGAHTVEMSFDQPQATPPPAPPSKPAEPTHEPSWWDRTKTLGSVVGDIFFGPSGNAGVPGFAEITKGTPVDPMVILHDQAAKGNKDAQNTVELMEFAQKPRINITGSKAFQDKFDPKSTNAGSRFVTGAAKTIEGLTSLDGIYSLASIYAMPEAIAKPAGIQFTTDIARGTATGVAEATEKSITGDKGEGGEAWGNAFGNLATLVAMHYGHKALSAGTEAFRNRDTTAELDGHAQTQYKKDFKSLDDNQKVDVMYTAIMDSSPRFKKRVDMEMERLNQKRGVSKGRADVLDRAKGGVDLIEATPEDVRKERIEVAKKFARQVIERAARAEAFKKDAAKREAAARDASRIQGEKDRAADVPAQSLEEQRGYGVTEGRVAQNLPNRGVGWTSERESGQRYDPDPSLAPGIPVAEGRAAAGEAIPDTRSSNLAPAELRVEQIMEQQTGTSFSSKSIPDKRASAWWMETHHPEEWEAFKKTPLYSQYTTDVRNADMADATVKSFLERNPTGDPEALHPDADIYQGQAQVILNRLSMEGFFKSDPATYKALNEHSEKVTGKSFDSLDNGGKIASLATYLKADPKRLLAFLTPDIRSRMESGQHIDLANMSAESRANLRQQTVMASRDYVRRLMDGELASKMVAEERQSHEKELADTMTASLTNRTPSLEAVYATSRDMTAQASSLGFGQVNSLEDLFKIEKDALSLPARTRTPATNEFLTRMRQVRAAAEDHVLREIAESTARKVADTPVEARESNIRQVVHFSGMASDLRQAADDLRAQGRKQEADAAQRSAEFNARKADAIVAGAESVTNPAPKTAAKANYPMSVGRETRVVSPANADGLPAHYAIVDASSLQTSHLPVTYEKREGYNQNGQPRDYSINRAAQGGVETRAANLDLDQLLSNGATTMEGPPIIDQRAHVISGNGRSLSLLTAAKNIPEQFGKYIQGIADRSASFGLDPAEVSKYKNPVLVKVLDSPVDADHQWAMLGTELNRDPMMGLSESEQGVAMARLLTPENIERLTGIVESMKLIDNDGKAMTVREAMRARSSEIAKLMTDAGIINPNKRAEFLTPEGDLNEKSKMLFESMLSGLTVTDPAVIEAAPPAVKDKLARAGLYFLQMRSAGENWNLASYNTDAVRLITRAQEAEARLLKLGTEGAKARGEGTDSLIERYLHQGNYEDKNGFGPQSSLLLDGQALVPPQHPAVEAMARAIEESPREYASMIARYADRANGMQSTMFGAEHPAIAFNDEIASRYGNGNGGRLEVMPEEWGAVAPLSDTAKASIEMGMEPLPVDESVHAETVIADATPDSTSVTEALPEGPRTVRELRKALENHPNLNSEQADAAAQYLENILPRAMGVSAEELLGNRRLNFAIGGKDGNHRGYMEMIDEATGVIRLCDSADLSTFIHEITHYIRKFMKPEFQKIANDFVGAKPGEEWTDAQEEMFSQAAERYHYDGGIRRGKLEKVFSTLAKSMQSIYNAVTGRNLAKGTPELTAMFDKWYDWNRAERKPIATRIDPEAIKAAASGKVEIPDKAKVVERGGGRRVTDQAQDYVFVDREAMQEALRDQKNGFKGWEAHQVKGETTIYLRADTKKGRRLHQPGLSETVELARKAKDLEEQLKRENDPRRQALLRGQLNGIEQKLGGSTFVIGGKAEPKDTSVIQLVHGLGEMPTLKEPTTPAQAVTVQQVHGDPTAISLGGERGKPRGVSDGPSGSGEKGASDRPIEQPRAVDGEPRTAKSGGDGDIAKPAKNPLREVKAAKLKAPERPRGTPVVDPDVWRGHVEALGLPAGTPPPTVRLDPAVRDMMRYPGQAEAIEGVHSALQQHDATVLAAPTGSGKTHLQAAIAERLLGTSGDKVGLFVTRSQNLIHEADGFVDTARLYGVDVEALPSKMSELQTGMYATTYAGIRGNQEMLTVPWDFVLFDESGEARNWTDSEQGKAVVLLGHAADKVVYSSATPYSTVMELGYMHKLGLWPKGGFTEWGRQFGLTEVGPNTFSGGTSAGKLEKLRQQLIERGQWQTLHKDMDGVSGHVVLVPQTEEVRQGVRSIRKAFAMAMEGFKRAGMSRYLTPTAGHEAIYLKRYIEAQRLPHAIDVAKKAIADGWKPIIFSEYRSGSDEGMDFFNNLPAGMGEQINKMLPPLPDVVARMREEFGDKVGIFAGEANDARADELSGFMSGDKDALYMTYSAGGVGANAQDKVGDRPRMSIFLGLPWSGMMFEQGTGRPWRYGTKSNVANVFMTSDTLPEMKVLATKILPRMRALKAAVYGEKMESSLSKKLRESVGIPEEMLQYEQGQEVMPQAAEWEQAGEGVNYTKFDEFEMPKAKDAKNKGMKYKGQGKRLYQGPKDEDPWQKAANEAWGELMGRVNGPVDSADQDPPIPPGTTRLYHGSVEHGRYDGKAWFSTDRTYARNYRRDAELQYVDYPTEKINALADPDGYGQTPDKGFTHNLELDSSETGPRKPLSGKAQRPPAAVANVIAANEGAIKQEAARAARNAMGTGEPAASAAKRKVRDFENEAMIWLDDWKDHGKAASHFVRSSLWMFGMSGDRAAEAVFRDAKMPAAGAEIKRRMIDYDLRAGNYRGELGGIVAKISADNKLKPAEHETVTKIVEGKAHSDDPRLNKAADEYRKFFAIVRQKMADAGMVVVIYENGKRREVPYKSIENDPNYWPRMYDWNQKFVVHGPDGKKIVTSLGDIMNMPKGSERREALIERIAEQRGVSKLQAAAFFDRGNTGIRLAGNIERAREFDIPMYGRDRQAIERYVNQASEILAATEVHGQFREKTDAIIDKLPTERDQKLVKHILTADLDPARLHDSDRFFLRQVNRWLVLSKMALSPIKLPFHVAKTTLATNTRSVVRSLMESATSPLEARRNAVDCGAMVDYMKQAWMREYGMKTGGLDQKMLDFNGFTAMMKISRVIAAGAGRVWLEKYAYPELVKDPKNPVLRRKLADLYGYTDEEIDNLAAKGYGPKDVRKVELGAANWTTGSGRPSELPPALRGTTGEPVYDRLTTLLRISQSLHGFMFKTANLVNRTVWQELYKGDYKSKEPYQIIARFGVSFGIAGWALQQLLHLRHQMSGSPEADVEKRRKEWIDAHPMSKEALFSAMSDISMGMGVEVLTQLFNELATHEPKDKAKLVQQHRVINAATDMFVGPAGRDAYNAFSGAYDYMSTFEDTGHHKQSDADRRQKVLAQLANEEVPLSRYLVKPAKAEPVHHPRRKKAGRF